MKTRKPLSSGELGTIHQTLLEKTGRPLKGCLIEQAFTRSSYARRYGGGSNENLEYLGDTVLGYHVVRKLYEHYGTIHTGEDGCFYSFRAHEKDFTELKSTIVSNHTLAAIMDEWELCRYLVVGQSDIDNEIDRQEKCYALWTAGQCKEGVIALAGKKRVSRNDVFEYYKRELKAVGVKSADEFIILLKRREKRLSRIMQKP